jgi:hypothetical protein
MVKINYQTLEKLNGMMMVAAFPQIIQKWKMIPWIHLSNLAQNTFKKSKKKFRIAADEDVDDRSERCESDNSRFSQTSSIEQEDAPKLLQFS